MKLQDEGSRVLIVDAHGSGVIMAGHIDVREAEGYLGRGLGSEHVDDPVPVPDVIAAAQNSAPARDIHHWGMGGLNIR